MTTARPQPGTPNRSPTSELNLAVANLEKQTTKKHNFISVLYPHLKTSLWIGKDRQAR